jgi:phenylacetate-CoA ligase
MSEFYDDRECRPPEERERDLFGRLPEILRRAVKAPAYAEHLAGIDPGAITSREVLAGLPIIRKSDLPGLQKAAPPFAGFVASAPGSFAHLFTSPGPIFEPEGTQTDPWRAARALFAAGFRAGEVVLNTFSYHLVPGGLMLDSGARALGCAVIPAGPGNTEQQLELIAAYRPAAYCGTPDFLKILLGAGAAAGRDVSSLKRAVVSGAAFPRSLQEEIAGRGIEAMQAYATADLGFIAFETKARDGMVVNEDIILEVVRPGTGDPVPDGEVGEVVVTSLGDPRGDRRARFRFPPGPGFRSRDASGNGPAAGGGWGGRYRHLPHARRADAQGGVPVHAPARRQHLALRPRAAREARLRGARHGLAVDESHRRP